MSCQQQLIQEDPYIFTDTISNSTNFMHENNSQTKYVPLNRQTIYNRQFRQHEPTISVATDSSSGGASSPLLTKSTTFSDQQSPQQQQQKIIINPSSLKEKKNGLNNGKIQTSTNVNSNSTVSSSSPRTSPKFFKSHQQQQLQTPQNGKHILVSSNSNSSINHSIASVSKIQQPLKQCQQQQFQQNTNTLNHVAQTSSHLLPITGIKKEISNDDGDEKFLKTTALNVVKTEEKFGIKNEENHENEKTHNRNNAKKSKRTNKRKEKMALKHSRVKSQNVIVESVPLNAPKVQSDESNVIDKRLLHTYRHGDSESKFLTRDERLNMRKLQLRHVLNQYRGVNQIQQKSTEEYRMQFDKTNKLLKMLDRTKEKIFKKSITECIMRDCSEEAIVSSDYCSKHILATDKEQFLIRQCCFQYSDGHQCRIPVSDIMATVAVCSDHLNAPSHQLVSNNNGNSIIVDSIKPKKPPIQRKQQRTKTSPTIRPVKKCSNGGKMGRKKKSDLMVPVHRPTMIIHPSDLQKPQQQGIKGNSNNIIMSLSSSSSSSPSLSSTLPLKQENLQSESNHQFIHQNSGYLLASSQSSYGSMSSGNEDLYLKQDLMTGVCENSYESSDTGVGGLSENELISHDVIGNFDMESCAELSKVLSSLPSNTLDDLLTEPLHTSRDDEEYLDRAIEEVSATGMETETADFITAFEHFEGLDMLEMLDDDEQRQMISAATNLISMSGYMSHEQDNNYSAMPSPMMS
ncbi:hypothetical protein PVAND_000958 [Polypedilum vanderplanki]|uniref:KANL2-like probable zinc-finger domain-containing protein n=1 Tax=Polypedilum vanderplanki TaxID=319348 RepID=A0A9J6BLW2_POLVA|nr:hypothetical protein PVAND_000958 [Polypedilum vanderplanki]